MSISVKVEGNHSEVAEAVRDSSAVLRDVLEFPQPAVMVIIEDGAADLEAIECAVCKKMYKSKQTLASHVRLKHPRGGGDFTCQECSKPYPSHLSLNKHMRYMHQSEHRCVVCYRSFASRARLQRHKAAAQCQAAPTTCSVCVKVFSSDRALARHVRYKHFVDARLSCGHCRRVFTSGLRLANHEKTAHQLKDSAEQKPLIKCAHCPKRFGSEQRRAQHEATLHGQTCSRCPACGKCLKSEASLHNHLHIVHQKTTTFVAVASAEVAE